LTGFVPLHYVRGDFRFGEFAHAAAELLLFVGKGKIQEASNAVRLKQRSIHL